MESLVRTDPVTLEDRLRAALPAGVDDASVRLVDERGEWLTVRQGQLEPASSHADLGAMFTVWAAGGLGYAATNDLSVEGLRRAAERAEAWARSTAGALVVATPPRSDAVGGYESPVESPWNDLSTADRIDLLHRQSAALRVDDRIVAWSARLSRREVDVLLLTQAGGRIEQRFRYLHPGLSATASDGHRVQSRSHGAGAFCGQGGLEVLDRFGFGDAAARVGEQAIELLAAENCPSGPMDIVLAPDQMILQIHESIGHPLELDRILGDERNYAGTSFVDLDMFGSYRYGSPLLNVTFDPTVPGQLASYGFDDDGTPATREYLIRDGVLERPLGGMVSQSRAGVDGVANSRACSWNRPPIDRMANLNVEPGDSSFAELIESVESGVYMETNTSWSIDDSRNKFQFSCEYGRRITDGELGEVVRNPSYRGISATFWRNLTGVGAPETVLAMGTPNCGKGELNQVINTGHASPTCRFSGVDVFGADE